MVAAFAGDPGLFSRTHMGRSQPSTLVTGTLKSPGFYKNLHTDKEAHMCAHMHTHANTQIKLFVFFKVMFNLFSLFFFLQRVFREWSNHPHSEELRRKKALYSKKDVYISRSLKYK